jgi:hypothetical protein
MLLAEIYRGEEPPVEEWDFDRCPTTNDFPACLDWETLRQVVLGRECIPERAQQIQDYVLAMRQKYRRPTFKAFAKALREGELSTTAWRWLMLVGCHEWPRKSYLSLDAKERAERLKLLLPEFFDPNNLYIALACLAPQKPSEARRAWASYVATGKLSYCCAPSLADIDDYLRSGNLEARRFIPIPDFVVDLDSSKSEFLDQCEALWRRLVRDPKRRNPKALVHRALVGQLHELAAYRLITDFAKPYVEAIQFSCDFGVKGKPLYKDETSWRRAASKFKKRLKTFLA